MFRFFSVSYAGLGAPGSMLSLANRDHISPSVSIAPATSTLRTMVACHLLGQARSHTRHRPRQLRRSVEFMRLCKLFYILRTWTRRRISAAMQGAFGEVETAPAFRPGDYACLPGWYKTALPRSTRRPSVHQIRLCHRCLICY